MELLCIQSQEHDKLPLAELKAVIECEDMELDIMWVTWESKESSLLGSLFYRETVF